MNATKGNKTKGLCKFRGGVEFLKFSKWRICFQQNGSSQKWERSDLEGEWMKMCPAFLRFRVLTKTLQGNGVINKW